jgi:vancomycin resistance protein YoaR
MAVSEETLETRRGIGVLRPGRTFLAFVIAAVVGIGLVLGGLYAWHDSQAGRILPGVSAAGVDLGGLTPDQARAALETRYGAIAKGGLLLRAPIGSTTVPFVDAGRAADIDSMVADAAARGRGGSWLEETIAAIRLRLEPQSIDLRITYDHAKAAAAVDAFARLVATQPVDAQVIRAGTGFATVPSTDGAQLDEAAAVAAVDAAMQDPSTLDGAAVTAPAIPVVPQLTTASADAARASVDAISQNLVVASGTRKWTLKPWTIRGWISFDWVDGTYGPVIDRTKIPASFKGITSAVTRPVVNAAFLKDRAGHIVGAKADSAGRTLDVATTADRIGDALEARAAGQQAGSVNVALAAVLPTRTTADVTKTAPLMVMVGSWTTYWQVAPHNGMGANIIVPTRRLNGTVVQPGETFDFWQALGEVSFRTGYRLGGAIVDGHSVEGKALAGGICASSTTLFNAALRAGLEIDTRQPHWYYIDRYPLGLDATVSGTQTMRFTNDTSSPILIRGFASPGIVRFEIWSVPNGRTVTLSRPIVTNVVPGFDTTVRTAALKRGQTLRTEWPVDGKDVSVTRTVRDASGRIIHQETYISHYHRMIGINEIGIG